MRKIVFVFLVLLMPMSIMAQTEHMSFMGISMDCKISKFKKQLVAKGLNYYSEYTKFIKPQDHMAFLGTFSGEDAKIFVFFDPQSKLVHEVKVVIEHETQEVGRRHYLTLKDNLKEMSHHFEVLSFDNLALEQLNVKGSGILSPEQWDEFYMGDDGNYTFYIDLVKKEFSKNSVSDKRYPLLDSVDAMFEKVKVA